MEIVTQSSLNTEAGKIKSYNDNILKDINQLSSISDQLLGVWSGDDGKSFVKKINDSVIPSLNKLYDCIDSYSNYLSKVNSVFNSVDDNYNNEIDV